MSKDFVRWGAEHLVRRGGKAGRKFWSHECPHVIAHGGLFHLLTTQRYTGRPKTSVFCSADPLDFGIDDDATLLGTLPVAAPEVLRHKGRLVIAALTPALDGIRIAPLRWAQANRN